MAAHLYVYRLVADEIACDTLLTAKGVLRRHEAMVDKVREAGSATTAGRIEHDTRHLLSGCSDSSAPDRLTGRCPRRLTGLILARHCSAALEVTRE